MRSYSPRLAAAPLWAAPAVLILAGLAACQPNDGHMALTGSAYCTPFKQANTNGSGVTQALDPASAVDDCLHRWGYSLAPSRDPADIVAQAAMDSCSAPLRTWGQQLGQAPPSDQGAGADQASADQSSSTAAQQMRGAEARALFYVVQARAGGCAPPPANTLQASPMS